MKDCVGGFKLEKQNDDVSEQSNVKLGLNGMTK